MSVRVPEPFDGGSENGRENSFKASNTRALNSETLRRARESRYSREEVALSTKLARCSDEPSAERLQVVALERARKELEARVQDYDQQAHDIRSQLDDDQMNQWFRDSLLRQRLVIEHRLTSTQQELATVTNDVKQLKSNLRSTPAVSINRNVLPSADASRASANLSLFFSKSVTKRPYQGSLRPRSAEYVLDNWPPQSRRLASPHGEHQTKTHLRSRSLINDYRSGMVERLEPQSVSSVPMDTSGSDSLADTTQGVPTVDEFRNSFSSRVIPPARSRPRSSLRPLHTLSRERRSIFSYSRRSSVSDVDYGTVTILSQAMPKSKTPPLDDLPNTPLPSYVQSLMDNFERSSSPSVSLGLFERGIPDAVHFGNRGSLFPVLEQSSPLSTKGRSYLKGQISPNSLPRKSSGKQQSIFTLRLPFRPSEPASGSRSTLAASSSTSVADFSMTGNSPIIESTVQMRTKCLPSTRDHDLAMLDGAPDDIPDPPLPLTETRPTKGRSSHPFAVLRRVRSRLGLAGRR